MGRTTLRTLGGERVLDVVALKRDILQNNDKKGRSISKPAAINEMATIENDNPIAPSISTDSLTSSDFKTQDTLSRLSIPDSPVRVIQAADYPLTVSFPAFNPFVRPPFSIESTSLLNLRESVERFDFCDAVDVCKSSAKVKLGKGGFAADEDEDEDMEYIAPQLTPRGSSERNSVNDNPLHLLEVNAVMDDAGAASDEIKKDRPDMAERRTISSVFKAPKSLRTPQPLTPDFLTSDETARLTASLTRLITLLGKLPSASNLQAFGQRFAALDGKFNEIKVFIDAVIALSETFTTQLDKLGIMIGETEGRLAWKMENLGRDLEKDLKGFEEIWTCGVCKAEVDGIIASQNSLEQIEHAGTLDTGEEESGVWQIIWPQGGGKFEIEIEGVKQCPGRGKPSPGFCCVM